MQRFIILLVIKIVFTQIAAAQTIKGVLKDADTGEELTGAAVYPKNNVKLGTCTGLDGSFTLNNITAFPAEIVCSYLGYNEKTLLIEKDAANTVILLESKQTQIGEITVYGDNRKNSEISARGLEKNSVNVINVISAKSIEQSPDLTVANVIQRMSGVAIERNGSGDGQYAILRGMDKRFNYTLVNGIKIPSPDNKNRFVPLDIFPSELLDRLEVAKALTADMEGDGIGGAVNMVMKDAPAKSEFNVYILSGGNSSFFSHNYQSFNYKAIEKHSPNEKNGVNYSVSTNDFTVKNLHLKETKFIPNIAGGITYGNRFFRKKLGLIFAASISNEFRGNRSDIYDNEIETDGSQQITKRNFSNRQMRTGVHAKADFRISKNHLLMWYNAFMDFRNTQVRDAFEQNEQAFRLRYNHQTIFNSTLKGLHYFANEALKFDWAVSCGAAFNETPDNVQINLNVINGIITVEQNTGALRRWEHNSDKDMAAYANFNYKFKKNELNFKISCGGMYRNKIRDSYFAEYLFKPFDQTLENPREQIRGVHWNNFDEIKFNANAHGNLSSPLNYDADETVGAAYAAGNLSVKKWQFTVGVRVEHTNQGYFLKYPVAGAKNAGRQKYADFMPNFHIKYAVHRDANLRASYVKAINRPSFFEIVPYSIIHEDYKERGNPDLMHTTADNADIRYEYFPRPSEQFMAGIFYKRIKNPIEFGMMNGFGQDIFYMPMNFGDANNYGFEIDITKYFKWFGIRANYTFTKSDITTVKMRVLPNPDANAETNYITEYVNQTRPLFGQAAHVANMSLLIKDSKYGWNAQIAFSYTGERLCIVSRYLEEDSWQSGYIRLDASAEKKFKCGLAVFVKAGNLLNTPIIQYIKKNETNTNEAMMYYKGGLAEKKEYYGQNFSIGIKYSL